MKDKKGTVVFTAGELALLNCILTAEKRDGNVAPGTEKVFAAVMEKVKVARDVLTPDVGDLTRYLIK